MFHIPAHKNVAAAPAQVATQQLWMNLYRAGYFHREGKPGCVDIHPGDCYASREEAMADIEPRSHYVATVPFEWTGPVVRPNPADSVPTPLSASRRMAAAIEEARREGRPFSERHAHWH